MVLSLQMRKQRLKTIQGLAHSHTQRKWQNAGPSSSDSTLRGVGPRLLGSLLLGTRNSDMWHLSIKVRIGWAITILPSSTICLLEKSRLSKNNDKVEERHLLEPGPLTSIFASNPVPYIGVKQLAQTLSSLASCLFQGPPTHYLSTYTPSFHFSAT